MGLASDTRKIELLRQSVAQLTGSVIQLHKGLIKLRYAKSIQWSAEEKKELEECIDNSINGISKSLEIISSINND
jgi:hypothetical protein